jgi:acylphosphatase
MENVRAQVVVEGRAVAFFRLIPGDGRDIRLERLGQEPERWLREAVFEGDKEKVEQMIQWCHRGPSGARVTNVQADREEYSGEFEDFSIRY